MLISSFFYFGVYNGFVVLTFLCSRSPNSPLTHDGLSDTDDRAYTPNILSTVAFSKQLDVDLHDETRSLPNSFATSGIGAYSHLFAGIGNENLWMRNSQTPTAEQEIQSLPNAIPGTSVVYRTSELSEIQVDQSESKISDTGNGIIVTTPVLNLYTSAEDLFSGYVDNQLSENQINHHWDFETLFETIGSVSDFTKDKFVSAASDESVASEKQTADILTPSVQPIKDLYSIAGNNANLTVDATIFPSRSLGLNVKSEFDLILPSASVSNNENFLRYPQAASGPDNIILKPSWSPTASQSLGLDLNTLQARFCSDTLYSGVHCESRAISDNLHIEPKTPREKPQFISRTVSAAFEKDGPSPTVPFPPKTNFWTPGSENISQDIDTVVIEFTETSSEIYLYPSLSETATSSMTKGSFVQQSPPHKVSNSLPQTRQTTLSDKDELLRGMSITRNDGHGKSKTVYDSVRSEIIRLIEDDSSSGVPVPIRDFNSMTHWDVINSISVISSDSGSSQIFTAGHNLISSYAWKENEQLLHSSQNTKYTYAKGVATFASTIVRTLGDTQDSDTIHSIEAHSKWLHIDDRNQNNQFNVLSMVDISHSTISKTDPLTYTLVPHLSEDIVRNLPDNTIVSTQAVHDIDATGSLQSNFLEEIKNFDSPTVEIALLSTCCENSSFTSSVSMEPATVINLLPSSTTLLQLVTQDVPIMLTNESRQFPGANDVAFPNLSTTFTTQSNQRTMWETQTADLIRVATQTAELLTNSEKSISPSPAQTNHIPLTSTAESNLDLPDMSVKVSNEPNANGVFSTFVSTSETSPGSVTTPAGGGSGHKQESSFNTHIIIASASAVFAVVLLVILAIICLKRRKRGKAQPPKLQGDELWVELHSRSPSHQMPLPSLTTCPSAFEISAVIKPEKIYRVHFPFQAQQSGQLSLKEGDVIQLIEQNDNGWSRGVTIKEGTAGWFPSNYVTLITGSTEYLHDEHPSKPPSPSSPQASHVKTQRQISSFQIKKDNPVKGETLRQKYPVLEPTDEIDHVECWVNMAASASMTSLPITEMSCNTNLTDSHTTGHKFQAVYAYKPVCKGEMALKEGELVVCKEKDRNGWMLGYKPRTDEEGWFPAVYVDEIPYDHELFCNSEIPETYDILESNKLHKMDQTWTGIEHRALFEYKSSDPADLQLKPNNVIIVLITLANGWWFGMSGNRCGWCPGSYLEMMEDKGLQDPVSTELDKQTAQADNTNKKLHQQLGAEHEKPEISVTPDKKEEINQDKIPAGQADSTLPLNPKVNCTTEKLVSPMSHEVNSAQATVEEIILPETNTHSSNTKLKPNRRAPDPPKTPEKTNHTKIEVHGTDLPDSFRKPSRPAPPPPKRKDSKVRKPSLTVNGTSHIQQFDTSSPSHPAKPVIIIHGKRPKLIQIARSQLDEKQLNPMIRPATRGFKPKPSDDAKSRGLPENDDADINRKSHTVLPASPSPSIIDDVHNENPYREAVIHPFLQIPMKDNNFSSTASLESGSDSKFTSPTSVFSNQTKSTKESPSDLHGSKHPNSSVKDLRKERSVTPESKRERQNSPFLFTTSNLIQNVQRFNNSLRATSPSPSLDSEKGSVKSTPARYSPSSTPPHSYSKKTGRSLKTLTTVAPPKVPKVQNLVPNSEHKSTNGTALSDELCSETASKSVSSSAHQLKFKTANDGTDKSTVFLRGYSNTSLEKDPAMVRDSLVVTPGKVSEIVQQINKITPNKTDDVPT